MSLMESRGAGGGKDRPRLVAVIPAYNEERFIGSVVLKAKELVDVVIVVDDGSEDETGKIARNARAMVVQHGANRGKGAALNTGFRAASEMEPEAIAILDGDGQHRPEELSRVLSPILRGEADVVVGSRYLTRRQTVPFHRILGHRVFTFLTNVVSGTRVTDSQSGFRAFSPRAVRRIRFSSNGFAADSEVQFEASDHGLRVCEVPISACYEDKPKRSVWAHGLQVLRGLARLAGRYRPLLLFGGLGIFVSLVGLALVMRSVGFNLSQGVLSTVTALLAIALLELGGQVLFTGVFLHSVRALLVEFQHRDEG